MKSGVFVIVEALDFTSAIKDYFGDDTAYADFQHELIASPDKGTVIPGAAPIRKIRWGDKRRDLGKRGGLRIHSHPVQFMRGTRSILKGFRTTAHGLRSNPGLASISNLQPCEGCVHVEVAFE